MRSLALTLIIWCVALCGFARVKYAKTKIDKTDFVETISVETKFNLMFTYVEIEGKKYKFLIDTGAPFSISPELAAKIEFKQKGRETMRSSNSKKGVQEWGIVKKVKIGSVGFSKITAFVIDFRVSEVLACLDFDGIIGSNLMNTCIWQFHHDEKKVIFTDNLARLNLTNSLPQSIYQVGKQKAPYVKCKVNKDKEKWVLFDTGSGDFFDFKYKTYYDAEKAGTVDQNIQVVTGRGLGSSGIYGAEDTTQFMIKLPELTIAGVTMKNVVADMSISRKSRIGIRFAKGRIVTFDFPKRRLYIDELPNKNIERDFETFGFRLFPKTEGNIIGSIWENSSAEESKLPKYAPVVRLNELDFTTQQDNCVLTFGSSRILREEDVINVTVDVDGKEREYKLEKRNLFNLAKEDED